MFIVADAALEQIGEILQPRKDPSGQFRTYGYLISRKVPVLLGIHGSIVEANAFREALDVARQTGQHLYAGGPDTLINIYNP